MGFSFRTEFSFWAFLGFDNTAAFPSDFPAPQITLDKRLAAHSFFSHFLKSEPCFGMVRYALPDIGSGEFVRRTATPPGFFLNDTFLAVWFSC